MSRRWTALALAAVGVAGGLLAVQSRVNGALGTALGSALLAAMVSFAGGTVLLTAIVAGRSQSRAAARRLARARTRWWWWTGGLAGAAVVATSAAGVPRLGVALVSVCLVAGTTVGALVVDRAGLGPGGGHRISIGRFVGVAGAVAAVLLAARGGRVGPADPLLVAGIVAAGVAAAVQQAANGRLRVAADDVAVAALVSFAVGALGLVALIGAVAASTGIAVHGWPGRPALYTGGLFGALYIAVAAATVRALGVLRVSLATVAGQLLAAVALDALAPAGGTRLHVATVAGAVLTLLAVAVAARDPGPGRGRSGAGRPGGAGRAA